MPACRPESESTCRLPGHAEALGEVGGDILAGTDEQRLEQGRGGVPDARNGAMGGLTNPGANPHERRCESTAADVTARDGRDVALATGAIEPAQAGAHGHRLSRREAPVPPHEDERVGAGGDGDLSPGHDLAHRNTEHGVVLPREHAVRAQRARELRHLGWGDRQRSSLARDQHAVERSRGEHEPRGGSGCQQAGPARCGTRLPPAAARRLPRQYECQEEDVRRLRGGYGEQHGEEHAEQDERGRYAPAHWLSARRGTAGYHRRRSRAARAAVRMELL